MMSLERRIRNTCSGEEYAYEAILWHEEQQYFCRYAFQHEDSNPSNTAIIRRRRDLNLGTGRAGLNGQLIMSLEGKQKRSNASWYQ